MIRPFNIKIINMNFDKRKNDLKMIRDPTGIFFYFSLLTSLIFKQKSKNCSHAKMLGIRRNQIPTFISKI